MTESAHSPSTGVVGSLAQVGIATDLTATEARDGLRGCISGEVALWHRHGTTGIAEAEEIHALPESVIW